MLKSDFHVHTNADPMDGWKISYSPKDIIRIASKKGFEVLALTHHHHIYHNPEMVSFAKERNILLVPGLEATVEGKHVVILNRKYTEPINTFANLEQAKDENILVIAPHPFHRLSSCLGRKLHEHVKLFDAVEYSSFYTRLFDLNKKAVQFAKMHDMPLVGTSDAHHLCQFNKTFSIVDSAKNVDDVLEAVRKGKLEIKTTPMGFWEAVNMLIR